MGNDNSTGFGHQASEHQQFGIKVYIGNMERVFNVRALGELRYEILDDQGSLGTILLDGQDHARCESVGCELDLPLMHAIREAIQSREDWSGRA